MGTKVREKYNLPNIQIDESGTKIKELEDDGTGKKKVALDDKEKAKTIVQELIGNIKASNLVYDGARDKGNEAFAELIVRPYGELYKHCTTDCNPKNKKKNPCFYCEVRDAHEVVTGRKKMFKESTKVLDELIVG